MREGRVRGARGEMTMTMTVQCRVVIRACHVICRVVVSCTWLPLSGVHTLMPWAEIFRLVLINEVDRGTREGRAGVSQSVDRGLHMIR